MRIHHKTMYMLLFVCVEDDDDVDVFINSTRKAEAFGVFHFFIEFAILDISHYTSKVL